MTKTVASLVLAFLLVTFFCPFARGQNSNMKLAKEQLKARQKQERKELKLREKYLKESLKGQHISKAMRIQAKHQMQREERQLREKQKEERQKLKDEQRLLKESQKHFQNRHYIKHK